GRVGGLVLILLFIAAAALAFLYEGPGPAARQGEATTVIFERGRGVPHIAHVLGRAGVIRSETLFMVAAKLGGGSLKAGEYAIAGRESMAAILGDLRAGRVVRHFVTIPEGWTSAMAADAVNASPVLTGAASAPPEGAILPETYEVQRGDDRGKVMARMEQARD